MTGLRSIFLFVLLLFAYETSLAKAEVGKDEEFSEALLLRPLPDRKVLAHFHFQSRAPPTNSYGRHHHLFPKSIYQLSMICKQQQSTGAGPKISFTGNGIVIYTRSLEL